MAKKSLIQREKKRKKLEQKYHLIHRSSKNKIRSKASPLSLNEKTKMQEKLQSLPRNSAPTRLHRRCFLTGRPRANYRDFGLYGHYYPHGLQHLEDQKWMDF
ncbi:hypothetical protein QOZ80_3AG0229410 [Eleusine coracana subsp. coracana]|nr:hypothetical protein QOZ80_3AG0229410 [Eleusine coracana subsp. coracana]